MPDLCMCLPHVCRSPWSSKEGVGPPGTGDTGSCQLPCAWLGTKPRSSAAVTCKSFLTTEPPFQHF